MALQFYSTLTRRLEPLTPLVPGQVSMYNCGPTVYQYVHIGNLRTFLFADLLARYLEFRGFAVRQVMNITDVGHMYDDADVGADKLEEEAKKTQKTPWEIADYYTQAFLEDMARLRVRDPLARPKATAYVAAMIGTIEQLLAKGHAYAVNGSVYYDISTFPAYGQLAHKNLDELQAGFRIEPHPDKKNPFDFALWIHEPTHIMQWEAPWSRGYPGWHIECSSMINAILGPSIDIHTGGEDNIFPHHECEIAQSQAAHGAPLAAIWMHAHFLMVDGEKMAKSKGNFYRLADLEAKGFAPDEIRFALIRTHYRSTQNFTLEALEDARQTLRGLNDYIRRLETVVQGGEETAECERAVDEARVAFQVAMDDDLNIARGLEAIFGLRDAMYKQLTKGQLRRVDAQALIAAFKQFDEVLQVMRFTPEARLDDSVRAELETDIRARRLARAEKQWAAADQLRDKWAAQGVIFEDIAEGTRWISAGGDAGLVPGE